MGGPLKGRADYWEPGDWDAVCSMCGRKRKASTMEKNWQGLYRCPIHNEIRQPQDFVRGVKDDQGVPWAQPYEIDFVQFPLTFPARAQPNPLILTAAEVDLFTENSLDILTEAGDTLIIQFFAIGTAQIILPGWVIPQSYTWTFISGTGDIIIDSPTSDQTNFETENPNAFGVAQCIVTDSLGGIAVVLLTVAA